MTSKHKEPWGSFLTTVIPIFLVHELRAQKIKQANTEAATRSMEMRITLSDVPDDVLAHIAGYLNYQSVSRLLACNKRFSRLLTGRQLDALKARDPIRMFRREQEIESEWRRAAQFTNGQQNWIGRSPQLRCELPCYTCLDWLDHRFFSFWNVRGRLSLGRDYAKERICLPCRHKSGQYGTGPIAMESWATCFECGRLAWAKADPVPSAENWPRILIREWQVGRFCVDCAGAGGEHIPALITKREVERQARRRERDLLKPNYQAREAKRVVRRNRYTNCDSDPLMTNLTNDNISRLFEEAQDQENVGKVQHRRSDYLPSALSSVDISSASDAVEAPEQLVAAADGIKRAPNDVSSESCRHFVVGVESTPEHTQPISQRRQSCWKLLNILQRPCAVLKRKTRKRYLQWKISR